MSLWVGVPVCVWGGGAGVGRETKEGTERDKEWVNERERQRVS